MMKSESCISTMLACIIAGLIYFTITFGISFAIAYLAVSMKLVAVHVFKLAALIWLVKVLFFNFNIRKGND